MTLSICGMTESIPKRLRALRNRAGLSMEEVAVGLGYKAASGYQRFETEGQFKKARIDIEMAQKLAALYSGKGKPPIEDNEVIGLAGQVFIDRRPPQPVWAGDGGQQKPEVMRPVTLINVDGDTYAKLPLFDIRAQAGKGALAYDGEPIGWRLFDQNYLRSITRNSINSLKVIEVSGDSMEPTLYKGDHVLVDLEDRAVARHGLFVLRLDESLVVKRVQKTFKDGAVKIISDNSRYETEEISDPERLTVIGRVIWLGRSVG